MEKLLEQVYFYFKEYTSLFNDIFIVLDSFFLTFRVKIHFFRKLTAQ